MSKAELEVANKRLRGALSGAQKGQDALRARGDKRRGPRPRRPDAATLEAKRLAGEAQRANSKLERLLAKEKARVRELKRQLGGKVGERLK